MNNDNRSYFKIDKIKEDIIFTPNEGYDKVLIWLPGLGDTAKSYVDDIEDERRPVPSKMKVVLLTATLSTKNNKNSWYEYIDRNLRIIDNNCNSFLTNIERITKVIDYEAQLLNNDYSRVFLGGFSQGSAMSFLIGLTLKSKFLGGIICCSGFYFNYIKPEEGRKKLPILICHGTKDDIISFDYTKGTYKHLFDEGFEITYKTYDFDHTLTWAEYKDIREFIENNTNLKLTEKF